MSTGDKPWLKYYNKEAINAPMPSCTMYEYIYENNRNQLDNTAIRYFGVKISYRTLFEKIEKAAIEHLSTKLH